MMVARRRNELPNTAPPRDLKAALRMLAEAVVEAYETLFGAAGGINGGPGTGTAPRGRTAGAEEVARRVGMPERTGVSARRAETLKEPRNVAARVDARGAREGLANDGREKARLGDPMSLAGPWTTRQLRERRQTQSTPRPEHPPSRIWMHHHII